MGRAIAIATAQLTLAVLAAGCSDSGSPKLLSADRRVHRAEEPGQVRTADVGSDGTTLSQAFSKDGGQMHFAPPGAETSQAALSPQDAVEAACNYPSQPDPNCGHAATPRTILAKMTNDESLDPASRAALVWLVMWRVVKHAPSSPNSESSSVSASLPKCDDIAVVNARSGALIVEWFDA